MMFVSSQNQVFFDRKSAGIRREMEAASRGESEMVGLAPSGNQSLQDKMPGIRLLSGTSGSDIKFIEFSTGILNDRLLEGRLNPGSRLEKMSVAGGRILDDLSRSGGSVSQGVSRDRNQSVGRDI